MIHGFALGAWRVLFAAGALALFRVHAAPGGATAPPPPQQPALADDVPAGLRCLVRAYPQALCGATKTTLEWCDGTSMPYDDGVMKEDFEALLNTADLEDQMAQRYPLGAVFPIPPPLNHDPGRIRHEPFFRKMYGATRAHVARSLGEVRWLPKTVNKRLRVTTINGVDRALQAVSDDLEKLPPDIRAFAEKPAGTFYWRAIRGTDRLSMHSFAVAIDIAVDRADFWRWVRPGPDGRLPYRNRIPLEIVTIFERHGFIWGGKWYHFDTMHFEYRPELLDPECATAADGP